MKSKSPLILQIQFLKQFLISQAVDLLLFQTSSQVLIKIKQLAYLVNGGYNSTQTNNSLILQAIQEIWKEKKPVQKIIIELELMSPIQLNILE
ncbi:unnamed protein product [Paramecium primaurelia]|uniref:Uncharacterized protein n=1 Tax=Paramecium primaurelia TaxID=5886 RepID=A0A8S1QDL8_PARPR|nr:unnamed protein product [Paramecium primaurelia]